MKSNIHANLKDLFLFKHNTHLLLNGHTNVFIYFCILSILNISRGVESAVVITYFAFLNPMKFLNTLEMCIHIISVTDVT